MVEEKPVLVILPGWGGSRETWKNFIALAEHDFRVICINLPCFGDEPCPTTVWGVEEYARFVAEKIRLLSNVHGQLSKAILLGHSFGGQVAVRLASEHPELFSYLVLVGASAIRPRKFFRRSIFFLVAKTGKLFFRFPIIEKWQDWFKELLYKAIGSRDYTQTAGVKRDIFQKIIRQDLTATLPRITTPTLVLWGSKDSYVPLRTGKKIARLIPYAEFKIFPNAGHGLHLTHAEAMIGAIESFIYHKPLSI